MSFFQNVRELFRRSEKPGGTVRFRRHAGLLSMRLRHQQRTALDSDRKGGGSFEGEAFRWRFDRSRSGGKSPQSEIVTPFALEGQPAAQKSGTGSRANTALSAGVSPVSADFHFSLHLSFSSISRTKSLFCPLLLSFNLQILNTIMQA
jgi:hypothetical protein